MTCSYNENNEKFEENFEKNDMDYLYEKEDFSRECKINDYNFRLVRSRKVYDHIMRLIYYKQSDKMEIGKYIVYIMERNDRSLANIVVEKINEERVLNRYDMNYIEDWGDEILLLKCRIAIYAWCRYVGVYENYFFSLDDFGDIMKQDFIIEPAEKNDCKKLQLAKKDIKVDVEEDCRECDGKGGFNQKNNKVL